jgi:hypothetical protein
MELPLREIHLPPSIHWWPLALGWWLVIGFVILILTFFVFFTIKALRPSLKKQAAYKLNSIAHAFVETENSVQCVSDLSAFLRRVVLSQEHAQKYAGLTGLAWLECLDKPLGTPEFSQGVGRVLLKGPYQPHIEKEEVSQLIQLCRKWVKSI